MVDDGKLKGIRVGDGWQLFEKPESLPLTLRLEKQGDEYTFKLRHDPNEAWTVLAPQTYSDTPQYVGLLGRGFSTGSDVMNLDWSYFQLERWTAQEQMNSSQSQNKPQGNGELEGATSEPTRTPSESSTPTRIPTSTPTVTPTRTPISTPVWTPTSTMTPVSELVPGELNPVPNFVLARYDQPGLPHKAMSILSQESMSQTIDYTYDPLGRLTAADYSTGDYYLYTYDAVGNRLSQNTSVNNQQTTTSYQYDIANRMIQAGNATHTWDNNGNLLNDGVNTYTYDPANRLTSVNQGANSYTYTYNGLGDRLQQTVNSQTINYTLDLNAGLTQVLDDGTNTYLYGWDRIAQVEGSNSEYFLEDALGSIRQLTDADGTVFLYQGYDPYGVITQTLALEGVQTSYGYAGEAADETGLTYLRARYYSPVDERFLMKDTWDGNYNKPLSLDRWTYVEDNPINQSDPSGLCRETGWQDPQGLFTQANCNALEADLKKSTTAFTESWYRQLATRERTDGLVETSAALEYFLDGTGGQRTLSSVFVKNTIEVAMPEIHGDITNLVTWFIQKNFGGLANCNSLNIGPKIFTHGYTANYPMIGFGLLDREQEVAGTMGSFLVYVELSGGLNKKPLLWFYSVDAQITVHTVFLDAYNWNKGSYVFYPARLFGGNQILDNWAANLEKHGSARSYIHRGDYTYVNSQNNVLGPGLGFDAKNPPAGWGRALCIGSQFNKDPDDNSKIDYCGNPIHP